MQLVPLGDSALLVRVGDSLGPDPEAMLDRVLAVAQALGRAALPGVVEVAPAYVSVALYFDPLALADGMERSSTTALELVAESLPGVLASLDGSDASAAATERRLIEIPVCYGGELGPDLEEVARRAGLSTGEVVARHSGATYLVHCLGFTPGFPYLSGLPPELATPRREVPRKAVPAGSVGIGGAQTGVYPLTSPGGWHLLGRTPERLFAPERAEPTLLHPGDRVRFRPISITQFQQWAEL